MGDRRCGRQSRGHDDVYEHRLRQPSRRDRLHLDGCFRAENIGEPCGEALAAQSAFDDLGSICVEFRTHWHNRQSRAAIEKLGAKQDGVLRNHQLMPDGGFRDTVVCSILPGEWPTVRAGLEHRLGR